MTEGSKVESGFYTLSAKSEIDMIKERIKKMENDFNRIAEEHGFHSVHKLKKQIAQIIKEYIIINNNLKYFELSVFNENNIKLLINDINNNINNYKS